MARWSAHGTGSDRAHVEHLPWTRLRLKQLVTTLREGEAAGDQGQRSSASSAICRMRPHLLTRGKRNSRPAGHSSAAALAARPPDAARVKLEAFQMLEAFLRWARNGR